MWRIRLFQFGPVFRAGIAALTIASIAAPASADSAPRATSVDGAAPGVSHLTVKTETISVGGRLRIAIYANENDFLKNAVSKYETSVDELGVARISLDDLTTGAYAVVVYHDVNMDGRLNRTPLGLPKEPYAFSNGVRPKLRRPKFGEAAVVVAPGANIQISLPG